MSSSSDIDHYRKVLATERDPKRREFISRLLAGEQSKLAAAPETHEGVSHLNVKYYQKRLETETDLVIRQILVRLIAEEEARMAPPDVQKASGDG